MGVPSPGLNDRLVVQSIDSIAHTGSLCEGESAQPYLYGIGYWRQPISPFRGNFIKWLYEMKLSLQILRGATTQISTGPLLKVHILSDLFGLSGLSGSAVDKRTRNNLYICAKS